MKFLVIGDGTNVTGSPNPKEAASFLESVVIPNFEILDRWTKEGKIVGGNFLAQRKGAFIVEAASAEEVSEMISNLPLWPQVKFEIHQLESAGSVLERTRRQLQQAKGMAAARHA